MRLAAPIRSVAIGLGLAAVGMSACGGDGDGAPRASGARTVAVEMRDIAFSPERVEVRPAQTVRFRFTNVGKVKHDAFVGDQAAQDAHEAEMRGQDSMGGMNHGSGGDEEGITVDPGKTGELTHTFRSAGSLLIGCHQPGHYAAGMRVTVDVKPLPA